MLTVVIAAIILLSVSWSDASPSEEELISDVLRRSLQSLDDSFRFDCSEGQLQDGWSSLSLGCAEFLTTNTFNFTNYRNTMRGLCEKCGEPLYELIQNCLGESGRLLHTLDVLCAFNERGVTCYDALSSREDEGREMFSDCQDTPCNEACSGDLRESVERHGCCMFSSVAALSDERQAERLWRRCDVEPPSPCRGAFSSTGSTGDSSTPSRSAADRLELNTSSILAFVLMMFIL